MDFVICTGGSDTQIKAIADAVEAEFKKTGDKKLGKEGCKLIMDYLVSSIRWYIMTEEKEAFII